jgi:hypothetical protein
MLMSRGPERVWVPGFLLFMDTGSASIRDIYGRSIQIASIVPYNHRCKLKPLLTLSLVLNECMIYVAKYERRTETAKMRFPKALIGVTRTDHGRN